MAELSQKRSDFYKNIYFPSVYYGEVFQTTLEDAKDIQAAQRELNKLLIDADTNLARLSETFRERALSPGQQLQLQADRDLLQAGAAGREAARRGRLNLIAAPAAPALKSIQGAIEQAQGEGPPIPEDDRKKIVAAEAKKAIATLPEAVAYKVIEGIHAQYPEAATGLVLATQDKFGKTGLTIEAIKREAATPEAKQAIEGWAASATGAVTPAEGAAQARLSAMESPFANASTEQTAHVAAGISDDEDDLLRLYLERLQDKESPGVVTEAEFEADPQLAQAEQVYNRVKADNSYQKSAAEWFSNEYLTALKTKSTLEAQAKADPFEGLDPYRWAQREALKRGGYTKESLLHLNMLTTRPDVAPYVGPAFTRLRAEGGLEPQSAAEDTIRAAYEQNPKITLAELDSLLAEKRQALTKQVREASRGEGITFKEGMKARKGGREAANELYASPEAAEQAKAYLLALRLNAAGTKAAPDVGTKVEIPVTKADVAPTPQEAAGATVSKAAATAQGTAEEASQRAAEAVSEAPEPTGTEPAPTVEDLGDLATRDRTAPASDWDRAAIETYVPDPTGGDWVYSRRGGKLYRMNMGGGFPGIPEEVKPGTGAYKAIESVLKTGQLPPKPKPAPKPRPVPVEAPPVAPAPAPAPTPTPAPVAPVEAPAPAPVTPAKALTPEELEALYGG